MEARVLQRLTLGRMEKITQYLLLRDYHYRTSETSEMMNTPDRHNSLLFQTTRLRVATKGSRVWYRIRNDLKMSWCPWELAHSHT